HGDRAAALLRHGLGEVTTASLEAVRVVAEIGSRRARRVVNAHMRALQQEAERTARLLDWIATAPDRDRWSALEICLRDHQIRMVDVVLAALAPAVEPRLARRLRTALRGSDQRSRASAFELIAAVPSSRLPQGAIPLLRQLLFEHAGGVAQVPSGAAWPQPLLAEAGASMSPWVRRAAAAWSSPGNVAGAADQNAGEHEMK